MIRFNIENALVVFSIFTIVKRLESGRSIFLHLASYAPMLIKSTNYEALRISDDKNVDNITKF